MHKKIDVSGIITKYRESKKYSEIKKLQSDMKNSQDQLRKIVEEQKNDLVGVDLSDTSLVGADLSNANLRNAILIGASLDAANLEGADLRGACLWDASIAEANLKGADLRGADLSRYYTTEAFLEGAICDGTKLRDAKIDGLGENPEHRSSEKIKKDFECEGAIF